MKSKIRNAKKGKWESRKARVNTQVAKSDRTRLTIFRSSKHIYAQLVDPESGKTVGAVSTRSKSVADGLSSTGSVEAAQKVGQAIAAVAREKQIAEVVFNRNGFLYHGRVKALAEAARGVELDLDLLLYDACEMTSPRLTLPHPRLAERDFVLLPLREISGPNFLLPGGAELDTLIAQRPGAGDKLVKSAWQAGET